MQTWAVSRRNYLLPRASGVLTSSGWNFSSSPSTIRTTTHKCASHQFSVAARRCRAQVCSLAQVNDRKTGAIWQTCQAWNSFLMFSPLYPWIITATQRSWQKPHCDVPGNFPHLNDVEKYVNWCSGCVKVLHQSKFKYLQFNAYFLNIWCQSIYLANFRIISHSH